MTGIDIKRIVGLDTKYGQTLQCAICLSLLDNPLVTKCGHNYCHQCLQFCIESGAKQCPKCRDVFTTKRSTKSLNHNNSVLIRHNRQNYVFTKNIVLNEMISKLQIKCDYHLKGCEEVIEGKINPNPNDCVASLARRFRAIGPWGNCLRSILTAPAKEDHLWSAQFHWRSLASLERITRQPKT